MNFNDDATMWQRHVVPVFVRPDDKVLRFTSQDIPVRAIVSFEYVTRTCSLEVALTSGRVVQLDTFGGESTEEAAAKAYAVRDRIIREIYDSPKRIVCAHEDDPLNEGGDS